MSCERTSPDAKKACFNGIYILGDMDDSGVGFQIEPCAACRRFDTRAKAVAYFKRALRWIDDIPDEMLPDLPPKTPES